MPIIIPSTVKLLPKVSALKLPPQEREKYYERVILDILIANKDGATAPEISRSTGFARRTIGGHLDRLVAIGEIHSITRGVTSIYYARNIIHSDSIKIKSESKPGLVYVVTTLKNNDGEFYYIQQKEIDDYRALRVKGSIMIPKDDGKNFIKYFHTHMLKREK